MGGELFHTYKFSLYTGMGGLWVHWCAFTCAINAMGFKMSLMSVSLSQHKLSLGQESLKKNHVSSNKSSEPQFTLRLKNPHWPILYGRVETLNLQICKVVQPNSSTPTLIKVHVLHNVLVFLHPLLNSNLAKNYTGHFSWFNFYCLEQEISNTSSKTRFLWGKMASLVQWICE